MKMKCENCGKDIQKDFNYCPHCGNRITKGFFSLFQSLFDRKRFEGPIEEPFKGTESQFFDLPRMKGGITIKVTGPDGTKISRIPFGQQVAGRAQMPQKMARDAQAKTKAASGFTKIDDGIKTAPPKKLVEPESTLQRDGNSFLLRFKLPDIKSIKDINIMKFPNSLELRARVKDKMYFKLMKLPENLSITNQSFDKGVLTVELS